MKKILKKSLVLAVVVFLSVLFTAPAMLHADNALNFTLTAAPQYVDGQADVNFPVKVTARGLISTDEERNSLVRFYAVIPRLGADNITFSGANMPEGVTNETERGYIGAQAGDLVFAWGPIGGFPLGTYETEYESWEGKTTE